MRRGRVVVEQIRASLYKGQVIGAI